MIKINDKLIVYLKLFLNYNTLNKRILTIIYHKIEIIGRWSPI